MQVFAKLLTTKSPLPAEQKAIDDTIQKHILQLQEEIKKIQFEFAQTSVKKTAEKFDFVIKEIFKFKKDYGATKGQVLRCETEHIERIFQQEAADLQSITGSLFTIEIVKLTNGYYDEPDWQLKITFL